MTADRRAVLPSAVAVLTADRRAVLASAVAVLAAANVLNNRVAPRLAPLTSAAATWALLALARRSGLSWSELGFHRGPRGLRIGGALASAVAGVYAVGIAVPATRRFFRDERALSLSRARALEEALLQVPVGTVLLEEVGFRGVLHALLARSHGPRTATAVSSALFGLWHVLPAIDMMAANPALSGLAAGEPPGDGPRREDKRQDGRQGEDKPRGEDRPRREDERQDGRQGGDKPRWEDARRGDGAAPGPPARASRWETARVVAGSVAATGLAGVFFGELRRRGGLAAPSLFHVATNSLGYLFARLAPAEPGSGGGRLTGAPGTGPEPPVRS
ncbi:CPBP family intramembrane glutamic endopeptidase [Streptosporangium minutum]|uniref:CPBP family intramembrane metalloprotease n=1 Tax=Streptosporangium minutum TaxID=569862 RepID=A0A243RK17_9ACTN|nr:CPBP family intramembrane glutamic endopeptidase [Streptosporangium minutum]OUC95217.1 CPBP family intramembrane metalloprotease [Streptosporangium minutum]